MGESKGEVMDKKDFLLYSNNIDRISDIDINAIVRVNLAWENTPKAVLDVLNSTDKPIFLDFPYKRSKFPLPVFDLNEAINIANSNKGKVKYFAVSNCESYDFVMEIREKLDEVIILVPKIETATGVLNFIGVCIAAKTKLVMLDREDLQRSLDDNQDMVKELVGILYDKAEKYGITILGLQGVVFSDKNRGENSSITKGE